MVGRNEWLSKGLVKKNIIRRQTQLTIADTIRRSPLCPGVGMANIRQNIEALALLFDNKGKLFYCVRFACGHVHIVNIIWICIKLIIIM